MSGLGSLGALLTAPRGDLALDVHADICGAGEALLLASQFVGSPVLVIDPDDAVRRVGVFRAADHTHTVGAAYASRLATALTVHMHKGRVLHMHNAPLAGISTCRHKDYAMTCEQFDGLLERSGQRCEICRRPGIETSHRQLYIDHDAMRGLWAVRGLLCGRCNSLLEHENEFVPAARSYLERAWYRELLSSLGIEELPAEPPLRAAVRTGRACRWVRRRAGWLCHCGYHRHHHRPKTWRELVSTHGPHHIVKENS